MSDTLPIESKGVCQIVGIRPTYLNKIVERGLYGVEPSLRWGQGKGSRRWFTQEDVFGIALVWWLFEAGLRTEVIKRVLRDLGNPRKASAKSAAEALQRRGADYLVIEREVRSAESDKEYPNQRVRLVRSTEITDLLNKSDKESLQVLPVRSLFADLDSRLREHEREGKEGNRR
jgi:hypothetical protein